MRETFTHMKAKIMVLENAEWSSRKLRKLLKSEGERSRKTAWQSEKCSVNRICTPTTVFVAGSVFVNR